MPRPSPPVPTDVRLQGPLAESASFVVMQAGRLALEWTAEALGLFDLEIRAFAALLVINRLGGITQMGLVERLGISKAGVSALVTALEGDGLVERRWRLFDGRQGALYVTRAGAELVGEAADELAVIDAEFVDRVGEAGIKALAEIPPPRRTPIESALLPAGLARPA